MKADRDSQFHSFVLTQRIGLVRTATLLTAGDAHLAEDLVQSTLTKLYVAWPAFRRASNPGGYLRRALVNVMLNERRRLWRHRERSMEDLPDRPRGVPDLSEPDDGLRKALRDLPPRMRAAVVFRFYPPGSQPGTLPGRGGYPAQRQATAIPPDQAFSIPRSFS